MNGFNRLKTMLDEWIKKNKEDSALIEVVDYLLERQDLEPKYLNPEKSVDGLYEFIHNKGHQHFHSGWCFISNNVVFSWAVMYFSLPNSFLKIATNSSNKEKKENISSQEKKNTNNVISIKDAKEKADKDKNNLQMSLFGGDSNE